MTALGFMMMAQTSITGFGGTSFTPVVAPKALEVRTNNKEASISTELPSKKEVVAEDPITVEEYVKNYFSDIPVMVEIAKCESRFRQLDKDGEVLRGEINSLDRGVMQINEYYHNEDSAKLGFDILTIEGNTAYARYLFEKYGVRPWESSSPCWKKTTAYSQFKNELAMK